MGGGSPNEAGTIRSTSRNCYRRETCEYLGVILNVKFTYREQIRRAADKAVKMVASLSKAILGEMMCSEEKLWKHTFRKFFEWRREQSAMERIRRIPNSTTGCQISRNEESNVVISLKPTTTITSVSTIVFYKNEGVTWIQSRIIILSKTFYFVLHFIFTMNENKSFYLWIVKNANWYRFNNLIIEIFGTRYFDSLYPA